VTRDKRAGRIQGEPKESPVDATLETDIRQVVQAVDDYLSSPSDAQREELVAQLTALDDQIAKSDLYESSVFGSGILGLASKGTVIGETSGEPFVEEVPSAEFRAQIALVRAAKSEMAAPTSQTMDVLMAARQDLKALSD